MSEALNENHWRIDNFKQRLTKKEWQKILLNNEDEIIYKGNFVKFKAIDLGYGVVEIKKDLSNVRTT